MDGADDVAAAEAELRAFGAAGGQTLVQWAPMGLGRRAEQLAGLSEAAGVHVVPATGLHQARHYPPETLSLLVSGLAERFIAEIREGLRRDEDPDGAPLAARAGLIKVAGDFHRVDRHAAVAFEAAVAAHQATGAAIAVHLEILLGGGDTGAAARASSGGGPGIPFLLTDIRARLLRDFGSEVVDAVFRRNPARAFDLESRR